MTNLSPKTYVNEPLDNQKAIHGNSRKPSDAPPEIQQKCIDIIIEEGRRMGFPTRDIAYYIAIAKHESGFNPDAASPNSTASGVSQVIARTGEKYGLNNANRFDARASIVAGLNYFRDTKNSLIKHYGQADGKYEAMIYVVYHYGQYFYFRDKIRAKDPIPLTELRSNYESRFTEAEQVLADGSEFERILKGPHALQIQIRDVLGKPLPKRKVVVVVPKAAAVGTPTAAVGTTTSTPAMATPTKSARAQENPSNEQNGTPVPTTMKRKTEPNAQGEIMTEQVVPNPEVSYDVKVYTTDEEGRIPALESRGEQPFVVLVPRENFEAYTEAVVNGSILEDDSTHTVQPRSDTPVELVGYIPIPPDSPNAIETESQSSVLVATNSPSPATSQNAASSTVQRPVSASTTNTAPQKMGKPSGVIASPIQQMTTQLKISEVDVLMACALNGLACVATSFAYMKQFSTKPKIPKEPFSDGRVKAGPVPVQGLSSSVKVQDVKERVAKATVVTKEQTAIKEVRANETAPWMNIALAEQTSGVQATKGDHLNDPEWRKFNNERLGEVKHRKEKELKLSKENAKPSSKQDAKLIDAMKQGIDAHRKKEAELAQKESEIESQVTNPAIVKYLKSTPLSFRSGLHGADSSTDNTPWCASFVNWVMEQDGYKGPTNAARASSWSAWGEELKELRYGAIVVIGALTKDASVDAETPSGSHVAFFVSQQEATQKIKKADSVEERKITKWKLLGGNQGGKIHRLQESEFKSSDFAIVAIRWPKKEDAK